MTNLQAIPRDTKAACAGRILLWSIAAIVVCHASVNAGRADVVVDFEDHPLPTNSFYNGSDLAGGFNSRGAFFNNDYSAAFSAWQGWSYSNTSNTTSADFSNQYSAWTGSGVGGSGNYGVAFSYFPGDAYINLPAQAKSMQITNTTVTALIMRDGNAFTNGPFGGLDGNRPDWLKLVITGFSAIGGANGAGLVVGSIDFYLADYRFADNALDYIVNSWTTVDLTSLAGAQSLSFGFESSDTTGGFINTPTYFAMDNLVVLPEPSTVVLLTIAGAGFALTLVRRRGKPIADEQNSE